jgi:hypothetical protein
VHTPTEDKDDDMKDSFYEEVEQVFDQFPRYHMKILLGDFNAKLGREHIFKPIIGNEPVSMAARSKARTVFGLSNIGIVGLNLVRGMDMCPRFSVFCCPV